MSCAQQYVQVTRCCPIFLSRVKSFSPPYIFPSQKMHEYWMVSLYVNFLVMMMMMLSPTVRILHITLHEMSLSQKIQVSK